MKLSEVNANRNIIYNALGVFFPLLAAAFAIPYLNSSLVKEGFSLVLILWAIIGYFSLFDFGIGRALTFSISEIDISFKSEITSFIKGGLLIVILTSFIGAILVVVFAEFIVGDWYKMSDDIRAESKIALYLCAVAVFPTTITAGLRGALEGLNKYLFSNINRSILGVGMFIAPVISIMNHGSSLIAIALYLLIVRIFVMLLAILQLKSYLFIKPNIDLKIVISKLFSYGMWVSLSGVIAPLLLYGDRLFLAGIIGLALIGPYATVQEAIIKLLVIPGSMASALFYEFSSSKNSTVAIKKMSENYKMKLSFLMLFIVLIIILFGKITLSIWISEDFASSAYMPMVFMSIGVFFNSIALIPHTILSSKGEVSFIAKAHLFQLILMIPAVFYFANNYGLIGAAVVWAVRPILDYVLLNYKASSILKVAS